MSTFEKPSVDSYSKQRDKWHQVNDVLIVLQNLILYYKMMFLESIELSRLFMELIIC